MVTFSDPKELRQALVEMDHHMVSSEMTAPEGGLASLVQHVLHVKLTEVWTHFLEAIRQLRSTAVISPEKMCGYT